MRSSLFWTSSTRACTVSTPEHCRGGSKGEVSHAAREGERGRERGGEGDGPAGAGVHGEVLHCDKWRLQGLGGCGPCIRVKGQHCRQQGHKLQAVQLIGQGAILVAMATDSCEI